MTNAPEFLDPSAAPVDVSRVCIARDARWDERNERLADAIRSSVEKPIEAREQIRQLLEAGVNINARQGRTHNALELAAYYEAPGGIMAMLAYASKHGTAPADSSSVPPPEIPSDSAAVLSIEFRGNAWEYFRIWAVNLFFTLLTLGIYSAWAKVRKKRYFYSHTTLDGTPFQYLGEPIPILKGRIVAVVLFLAWYLSSHFLIQLVPVVTVIAAVLAPWVIVRSAAFNARYSAFRNMTFTFSGSYGNAFASLYVWGLVPLIAVGVVVMWQLEQPQWAVAALVVLGVLAPFWLARLKRYLVGRTAFGGLPGELSITGGDYYFISFKTGLVAAGLMALAGIAIAAVAAVIVAAAGEKPGGEFAILAVVPFYLAYIFAYAYGQAQTGNLVWNNTRLGPMSFQSVLTGRGLAWLYITNGLAILLSAGLLIPWAVVRSFRYRARHLRGVLRGEWGAFRGSKASSVSAAGAEVGEMFDLDVSL